MQSSVFTSQRNLSGALPLSLGLDLGNLLLSEFF
jgi:hypothetical protein